jgi:hypothetical protein
VDWNRVGVIVFVVGCAGPLFTLLTTLAATRRDRTTIVDRGYIEPTRERTVIER